MYIAFGALVSAPSQLQTLFCSCMGFTMLQVLNIFVNCWPPPPPTHFGYSTKLLGHALTDVVKVKYSWYVVKPHTNKQTNHFNHVIPFDDALLTMSLTLGCIRGGHLLYLAFYWLGDCHS